MFSKGFVRKWNSYKIPIKLEVGRLYDYFCVDPKQNI